MKSGIEQATKKETTIKPARFPVCRRQICGLKSQNINT